MMYRILVVDEIDEAGLALLRATPDVEVEAAQGLSLEALRAKAAKYDAIITRSGTMLDADFFAAAGRLKVAARAGVGLDNVDVAAATRAGIMVMNIPEVNMIAAAELTMALMLGLMRQLPQANASMRAGHWERQTFMGNHLDGKVLGLIGLGRVGQLVAVRAKAFGMAVIAFDPYVSETVAEMLKVELAETLEEVLARADIISLHVQMTDETRGMIGAEQFAQMKRGARIINTARGALIEESALLAALESGQVAGAGLDVFVTEPVSGSSESLANHLQVVATPHLGASTFEAQRDVSIRIVQQVLAALRRDEYLNVVNLPFEDGTDFAMLTPFMNLAEKVGALQVQLMQTRAPMQIEIALQGELVRKHVKPLTVALLKGLLSPELGEQVNYVNAPYLSRERGVSVRMAVLPGTEDYANVVACRVTAGDETRLVAGTCLIHSEPRIVRVDDIPMDVLPEGWILAIKSHDVPGVIGQVATLLGANKLNIAEYRLGRDHVGGTAYSFVNLDAEAPGEVLEQLQSLSPVIEVKQVYL